MSDKESIERVSRGDVEVLMGPFEPEDPTRPDPVLKAQHKQLLGL